MEDTIRLLKLFTASMNSLRGNCISFDELSQTFTNSDSDGGYEITEKELRHLLNQAEIIEHCASRFVEICHAELNEKMRKELELANVDS